VLAHTGHAQRAAQDSGQTNRQLQPMMGRHYFHDESQGMSTNRIRPRVPQQSGQPSSRSPESNLASYQSQTQRGGLTDAYKINTGQLQDKGYHYSHPFQKMRQKHRQLQISRKMKGKDKNYN